VLLKGGEGEGVKHVPCMVRIHEGAEKGKKFLRRGGAQYKYPNNLGGEKEKK